MKNTLAFILVILLYACSYGQETYFTSGQGTGLWNDPQSWMLSETGPVSTTSPSSEANVVIRHGLTQTIESDYTHQGNIEIQQGAMFEIIGDGDYTYAGDLFDIKGTLAAAVGLKQKSQSGSTSTLAIRNTGLFYALRDFHMDHGAELFSEQNVCSAINVNGTLNLHGNHIRMVGQAKIICGEVRAWNEDGSEIILGSELRNHVSMLLGNNIEIYQSPEFCEAGNTVVSGQGGHIPNVNLQGFQARLSQTNIQISWSLNSMSILPDLMLERAWDGENFTLLQKVNATTLNKMARNYFVEDAEATSKKRTYRLSYVNELGEAILLGQIEYGPEATMAAYPNPYTGEQLTIQAEGFVEDADLSLVILDLQGRKLWQAQAQADTHGNLNVQATPDLHPGSYLIMVSAGDVRKSQRLLVF